MVLEDEEVSLDFFELAQLSTNERSTPTLHEFDEDNYDGEWLQIEKFLSTMTTYTTWTKEEAARI